MRIALVFLVLLGAVVLGLPFSVSGDSSLTGAVQSFMAYGLSATSVLLGMLTIFMSRSLSGEFTNRHIFLVTTKPIPRWQFLVGKWFGVTILNAVLLAFSGLAIYGMVHYIKLTYAPIDKRVVAPGREDEVSLDEKELNNEVLVARHAIKCVTPDFSKPAEAEFERNLEQGRYTDAQDFQPDVEKAKIARKYDARWRVVPALDTRVFQFKNVLCDRSPDKTIQLRYKTEVSHYAPDEIFRAFWQFGDPYKGTSTYEFGSRHVIGRYHTIRIPADTVAPDHTLTVTFHNWNPFPNEVQTRNVIEFRAADGPELLFVVGTFGWNLVRVLILVLCKLMFLSAVAILMTTVFSFPVACLASFTAYVLAASRSFLADALDFVSEDRAGMFSSLYEFLVQSIAHVYGLIQWILPNFGRYDAVETFVNGRNVSLVWVLQGISEVAIVRTTVILGIAILLFYRREVAEVSI